MNITHLCNRCASTLQTDKRGNNWCPVCKVYRPPFRDQGAIVKAPPLVTPADENLSTRGE